MLWKCFYKPVWCCIQMPHFALKQVLCLMHWKGAKVCSWETVQDLGELDSCPALLTKSLYSCRQTTVTPCVLKVLKIFPRSRPLLELSAIPTTGYWKHRSPPDTWGWCACPDESKKALLDPKFRGDFWYVTIRYLVRVLLRVLERKMLLESIIVLLFVAIL